MDRAYLTPVKGARETGQGGMGVGYASGWKKQILPPFVGPAPCTTLLRRLTPTKDQKCPVYLVARETGQASSFLWKSRAFWTRE